MYVRLDYMTASLVCKIYIFIVCMFDSDDVKTKENQSKSIGPNPIQYKIIEHEGATYLQREKK